MKDSKAVADAAAWFRKSLISADRLEKMRPPDWLVDGLIEAGSLTVLYGQSGVGKSFVGVDIAAAVISGQNFAGRQTLQGPVLYCAAEGIAGYPPRIQAVRTYRDNPNSSPFQFLGVSFDLMVSATVEGFVRAVKPWGFRLIVLDTFARLFSGNENKSHDVGLAVKHLDLIRHETGATVLLVHHSGKDARSGERGSSALQGAADARLELSGSNSDLKLKTVKQKNAEAADPIPLALMPYGKSLVVTSGEVTLSKGKEETALRALVTTCQTGRTDVRSQRSQTALGPKTGGVDDSGRPVPTGPSFVGVTHGVWKDASGLSPSTFDRMRNSLLDKGFVDKDGAGRYVPTDEGLHQVSPIVPNRSQTETGTEVFGGPTVSVSLRDTQWNHTWVPTTDTAAEQTQQLERTT